MSKERELLNKAIELIQIVSMVESIGKVSPDFGSELILEIQELLAQPVKYQFTTRLDQEPVMYQYRDKLDGKDWGRWNLCNKIDYEDYKNNPTFQHWTYQTRKLLAQPEQEPVAWLSISDIEWMNIVNSPKILELTDGRHNSEEAVNLAVKMTEEKCKKNNSDSIPKPEPFGPEERQRISKAYSTRAEQVAFEEGIIFAEISYGIGVDNEC